MRGFEFKIKIKLLPSSDQEERSTLLILFLIYSELLKLAQDKGIHKIIYAIVMKVINPK